MKIVLGIVAGLALTVLVFGLGVGVGARLASSRGDDAPLPRWLLETPATTLDRALSEAGENPYSPGFGIVRLRKQAPGIVCKAQLGMTDAVLRNEEQYRAGMRDYTQRALRDSNLWPQPFGRYPCDNLYIR